MLLIAGDRADTLADAAGDTPLFVYDSAMLTARVAEWRAAMPTEVQLHYAMKANPYAPLLAFMARLVDGFDVASRLTAMLVRSVLVRISPGSHNLMSAYCARSSGSRAGASRIVAT